MKIYEILPPCTPVNAALFSVAFLFIGIAFGAIITFFAKGSGTIDKLHLTVARTSIILLWIIITIKASVFNSGDYPNWFISAMFGLVVSSLDSKLADIALKAIDLGLQYFKSKGDKIK